MLRSGLALVLLTVACGPVGGVDGVLDGGSFDGGEEPKKREPPGPTIPEVPLELGVLSTTATCAPLGLGERVVAVSPEGHLWLGTSSAATTRLRVLDGWDPTARAAFELPFAAIEHGQAWSSTTASFIADGALWQIRDGARTAISSPIEIAPGARVCGDLAGRALVLSGGRLIERVGDEWFEWTGLGEVLTATASFLTRDGACIGSDDQVWLDAGGRALWKLSPTAVTEVTDEMDGQAAMSGDRLLIIEDGLLRVGTDAKKWSFARGTPRTLAAAGAYGWIVVEDALLRLFGEEFVEVEQTMGSAIEAIHPHASGGVWLEAANAICHLSPDSMLRVRGARNGDQREGARLHVWARATGSAEVTATLAGEVLAPVTAEGEWLRFESEQDLGWSTLELQAGEGRRTLALKRLPENVRSFEADIRPIYEASCSGGSCHSPDSTSGAPDFSRYEAWTARAARLRLRVVDRQDMPPIAARNGDWGEAQIAIINEWLSGGLRP